MRKYEDREIDVRLKLAGLWTSIMFFYVYADLLAFMQAKAEGQPLDKNLGPFGPITQGALLVIAFMLAIPASMIFLALVLKASYARWTNIVVGAMQLFGRYRNLPHAGFVASLQVLRDTGSRVLHVGDLAGVAVATLLERQRRIPSAQPLPTPNSQT